MERRLMEGVAVDWRVQRTRTDRTGWQCLDLGQSRLDSLRHQQGQQRLARQICLSQELEMQVPS